MCMKEVKIPVIFYSVTRAIETKVTHSSWQTNGVIIIMPKATWQLYEKEPPKKPNTGRCYIIVILLK